MRNRRKEITEVKMWHILTYIEIWIELIGDDGLKHYCVKVVKIQGKIFMKHLLRCAIGIRPRNWAID